MKGAPLLAIPALEAVALAPVEIADATATPVRDEETRILRDEDGLPIYEG